MEFATADAAARCKDELHGREVNGKKCVVTFAEIPKTPAAAMIGPNDGRPGASGHGVEVGLDSSR